MENIILTLYPIAPSIEYMIHAAILAVLVFAS